MAEGFILLHRQMMESDLWKSEPFTRGQAWVDLLMLANHQDGFFRCRGVRVEVKRGQVGHGAVALSKRWKWSRGKINRFLKELEIDQQIAQQKSNVTTLITITKYESYQSKQNSKKISKRTANGQQTDSKRTQTNNDNNENNEKEEKIYRKLDFSTWSKIPDKQILEDWFLLRKRKKANVSQTVVNQFGKKLFEAEKLGFSVDECLAECITKNWTGFEVEWMQNLKNKYEVTPSEKNKSKPLSAVGAIRKQIERNEQERTVEAKPAIDGTFVVEAL